MTLLECRQLELRISANPLTQPFDWSVSSGECWGILGSNGTGKSTLLKTIAGMHHDYDGELLINGSSVTTLGRKEYAQQVGMLLQETSFRFPVAVSEIVQAGRFPYLGWLESTTEKVRMAATDALESVGIAKLAQRTANTLSGGEARKVAMATLLCQSPRLALLDEPENHLDPGIRHALINRLKHVFTSQDKAMVMALHDPSLALQLCTHLLLIDRNGEVRSGTTSQMGTADNFSRLYDHAMCVIDHGSSRLVFPE